MKEKFPFSFCIIALPSREQNVAIYSYSLSILSMCKLLSVKDIIFIFFK